MSGEFSFPLRWRDGEGEWLWLWLWERWGLESRGPGPLEENEAAPLAESWSFSCSKAQIAATILCGY